MHEPDAGYEEYVRKLETLRKTAPDGSESWMARDVQSALAYDTWRGFTAVIERGQQASASAGVDPAKHFVQTSKMVSLGSGAQRQLDDWFLSRYACYVLAMNGDPAKREVGYAQTYFVITTRKQEVQQQLTDAEQRLLLRERVRDANRVLQGVAQDAGVARFGIFNDAGYRGLYGGLGLQSIKAMKGLGKSQDLLDHAGRAELAANEFRITQAEQKIVRDNVRGEENAVRTHRSVGEQVRAAIAKLGGTMPESLPAEPSIKKLKTGKPQPTLLEPDDSSE